MPDSQPAERVTRARRHVVKSFPGATLWQLGRRRLGGALLALSASGIILAILLGLVPAGIFVRLLILWFVAMLVTWVYEWRAVASVAKTADDVPTKLSRLAIAGLCGFVLALVICILTFRARYEVWVTPHRGMAPTVELGEKLAVQKTSLTSALQQGDVLVVRVDDSKLLDHGEGWHAASDGNRYVIGRIIGVPGDTVEGDAQGFTVNGKTVESRQADEMFVKKGTVPGRWPLAADEYFLAGDEARSQTSASYGTVRRAAVVGRARTVLWSSDPWRIGASI